MSVYSTGEYWLQMGFQWGLQITMMGEGKIVYIFLWSFKKTRECFHMGNEVNRQFFVSCSRQPAPPGFPRPFLISCGAKWLSKKRPRQKARGAWAAWPICMPAITTQNPDKGTNFPLYTLLPVSVGGQQLHELKGFPNVLWEIGALNQGTSLCWATLPQREAQTEFSAVLLTGCVSANLV